MVSKTLALLMMPIMTGLCAALWARLLDDGRGFVFALGGDAVAKVIITALIFSRAPTVPPVNIGMLAGYVFLCGAISLLWVYCVTDSGFAVTAISEVGWPFFAVAFGYLLIGNQRVTLLHVLGGIVTMAGAATVFYANSQSR